MKTALALAFIVACPAFASDPNSERRFEVVESTLERTLAGMKRMRLGMGEAEAERLLPIRSMESRRSIGQKGHCDIWYEFNNGRYILDLRFRDGLKAAHLWKIAESGTQGVSNVGEWP